MFDEEGKVRFGVELEGETAWSNVMIEATVNGAFLKRASG